jgi:ABC-type lipoprotein export system ATPase subunit
MELIRDVKLTARINHRPNELSGGEQQRAAIVRALVNRPKLVLCDEPTGNLDSQMGKEIIKLLHRLNQKQGFTFIIASHDPEIARLSHRVVRIKDGSILN